MPLPHNILDIIDLGEDTAGLKSSDNWSTSIGRYHWFRVRCFKDRFTDLFQENDGQLPVNLKGCFELFPNVTDVRQHIPESWIAQVPRFDKKSGFMNLNREIGWDIGQSRYIKVLQSCLHTKPLTLPEAAIALGAMDLFFAMQGQDSPLPEVHIISRCYKLPWFDIDFFNEFVANLDFQSIKRITGPLKIQGERKRELKRIANGRTASYTYCQKLAVALNRELKLSNEDQPVFVEPSYSNLLSKDRTNALTAAQAKITSEFEHAKKLVSRAPQRIDFNSLHNICASNYSPVIKEGEFCRS